MSESKTPNSDDVELPAMETTTLGCADCITTKDSNLSDTEEDQRPSATGKCDKDNDDDDGKLQEQKGEISEDECSAGDMKLADSNPALTCESKVAEKVAISKKEAMAEECYQGNGREEMIAEKLTEFDPNCYMYRTAACCEMIHCSSAALLLGGVEFLCLLAWSVIAVAIYMHDLTNGPTFTIVAEILVVIALITIVLMIYGIVMEKPKMMWPHMIMLIAMVVFGLALTVIAVCCMSAGPTLVEPIFGIILNVTTTEQVLGPIWPFTLAVIFDFGAAIAIWFYVVVRGCYEFLLDKEYFAQNPGALIALPEESSDAKVDKE
uniref:Uncharacterized protein n=1 Tax=Plectus sambesii TaxID=2011161 RepID=A0A914X5U2_9BILA